MRPIKFRQPRMAKGKFHHWHYWGYVDSHQGHFVAPLPPNVGGDSYQFSGLKDCKRTKEYPEGQEIYEGDIVKTFVLHKTPTKTYDLNAPSDPKVFVVKWLNHITVGFNLMNLKKNTYEIIGNIYENPGLLEEKK